MVAENFTQTPPEEEKREVQEQEEVESKQQVEQQSEAASQAAPTLLEEPVQELIKRYFGIDDLSARVTIYPFYVLAKRIRSTICVDLEGIIYGENREVREYMANVPVVIYLVTRDLVFRIGASQTDYWGRYCVDYTPTFSGSALLQIYVPTRGEELLLIKSIPVPVYSEEEFYSWLKATYATMYRYIYHKLLQSATQSQRYVYGMPESVVELTALRSTVEAESKGIRLGAEVETPRGRGFVYSIDYVHRRVVVVIGGNRYEFSFDEVKPIS